MLQVVQNRVNNEKAYHPLKDHLDTILIHRISIGNTVKDIIHAFEGGIPEAARVTGYKMPYHFVVDATGAVFQCLSLSIQGSHACAWNTHSIGIAAIGDFRYSAPTDAQWRSTLLLTAALAAPQKWQILGHDEAPGGSGDPNKKCPGKHWNMRIFRAQVKELEFTSSEITDFWRYVGC